MKNQTFFFTAKLTLKIPWKNLYEEPVVAEVDGIYALAVPNIGEHCLSFFSTHKGLKKKPKQ